MKKGNKNWLWATIAVIAVFAIIVVVNRQAAQTPGQYDQFTECLEEKGAHFYGAFWCSHCKEQKALFGKSKSKLPYTECSTADGKSMTAECDSIGIESYPTWEFADGSRTTGVQPLQSLATKTGCELPQDN